MKHSADFSGIEDAFKLPIRVGKAVLRDDGKGLAAALFCLEHFVAFFQGCRHRLLADDVHSGIQEIYRDFSVGERRSADIHNIKLSADVRNKLLMRRIDLCVCESEVALFLFRFFGVYIAQSDDFHPFGESKISLYMLRRDIAGADYCCFQHTFSLLAGINGIYDSVIR